MGHKKLLFGLLILVFAFAIFNCEEYSYHPGIVSVVNGTKFYITLLVFETYEGTIVKKDIVGFFPGGTKKYELDTFYGKVTATVRVNSEDVEVVCHDVRCIGGKGASSGSSLLLTGIDKETLEFF